MTREYAEQLIRDYCKKTYASERIMLNWSEDVVYIHVGVYAPNNHWEAFVRVRDGEISSIDCSGGADWRETKDHEDSSREEALELVQLGLLNFLLHLDGQ